MSRWIHALCCRCFDAEKPGFTPSRVMEQVRERKACCRCGDLQFCGINYRNNPDTYVHCNHDKE